MAGAYSVSQINAYIKNMFSSDFVLAKVKVSGEISNCKYHSSGHIYFSIKDNGGGLSCVMFAGDRKNLKITLREGLKVVVSGSINVYERDGKYQLYAKNIETDGEGELYKRFLELKNELEEKGMFDDMYKKPIPSFVRKVGIVTASTGAAIQDIINVAKRRNPYVQLYLYPAKVQGEGAAETIVSGIEYLDQMGLDVIIVGRGGGSIEDLWAFNEEIVAYAIFNCNTPIISGVGHEVDFTIADFVSDRRAPTPSAACELAVNEISQITDRIDMYKQRLEGSISTSLMLYRKNMEAYLFRLKVCSPEHKLAQEKQHLDHFSELLDKAMVQVLDDRKNKLKLFATSLSALSPLQKISGGFAYLESSEGDRITSISQVTPREKVKIKMQDGSFTAVVDEVVSNNRKE